MKHGDLKSARVGAIAGIAFVAFFLAGTMVLDPLTGATDQELRTWWSDSGERSNSIISMYMWLLAAPCVKKRQRRGVLSTALNATQGRPSVSLSSRQGKYHANTE